MSGHTPGPWEVDESGDVRQVRPRTDAERAAGQCAGYRVAILASGPADPSDGANARLIAAAPEMLEALQMLISCVYDADGASGYKEQWTEERPQIRAARAAIRKATGTP